MDTNTQSIALSAIGYANNYTLTRTGELLQTDTMQPVKYKNPKYISLKLQDGNPVKRSLKSLMRQAFGIEYAVDIIPDLPGESWEPLDPKGKYRVSSCGRVKSYNRTETFLMKQTPNQKGYLRVDLSAIGYGNCVVHKLVGLAFIPNDDPTVKTTIDHIDENKRNNNMSNLRWLSQGDNVRAYQENKKKRERAANGDCGST